MKSLRRPRDREAIVARLESLRPDAQKQWGRMSVDGMVCHLSDAFLVCLGDRAPERSSTRLIHRTLLRWLAISAPMPWPKGVPTGATCDQEKGGTPPVEFERDKAALRDVMTRFTERIEVGGLSHPVFGTMSTAEWGRWGYRHVDHHLRQFSA